MPVSLWAIVEDGNIKPLDATPLPEGAKVLVTLLEEAEETFWLKVSEESIASIWDNPEDDIYAQLLEE